jgi:endonuclease/exonuclease/phosphatase family metal-dependent hydrolase
MLTGLVLLSGFVVALVWLTTFHPPEAQAESVVCEAEPPPLQAGQSLKVLTYNVQYMAGKNYFFFYEGGLDVRPSAQDTVQTSELIAGIIRQEDPDLILLQEVDDGSRRTDYEDQLVRLLEHLPDDYKCHTSAFYWQADFIPHPSIWGAIGHKLTIISKYRIDRATRYQLPLTAADPITQQFSPKRAILETRLPLPEGGDLFVLTTHLEVSNRGADVMQRQTTAVANRLAELSQSGVPWLIGGDFNLLPPGQYERIREDQQQNFRPKTELITLFERHQVVPGLSDVSGPESQRWFTFFPNDPTIPEPDRTLDYIFVSAGTAILDGHVRRDKMTMSASDHLPVIVEIELPKSE